MGAVLFLLPLLNWSLKLGVVISLLFLFISEPDSEGSLNPEISEVHSAPEVEYLNSQISAKYTRLKFLTEKVTEIRKAIFSLEIKSGQILSKYNSLLRQLKSDLLRNESECRSLNLQITEMVQKRNKVFNDLQ